MYVLSAVVEVCWEEIKQNNNMKGITNSHNLNKAVKIFSKQVAKEVIKAFSRVGKKPSIWDYPAMASACCCYRGYIEVDHSKSPQSTSFHSILYKRLITIGKIGKKSTKTKCDNIIGQCAEVHAANKLLKRNKCSKLKDIHFSVAMRPRTLEVCPPCENCKAIFPTLK